MKKLFAVAFALMMAFMYLPVMAEDVTEIVVWCWDPAFNLYAINEAAKIYAEINPNVKITIDETASGDVDTKTTVALTSQQKDSLANIILCQDNNGRKFLNTFPGEFFEMTDLVDYANFAQYKINHFSFEGGVYAVPFDNGCAATFIRTDYLQEAGFTLEDLKDVTWDEFIDIGLAVKEATGNYMLTTQSGYRDFISMMVQSAGSWFFDEDGAPNLVNNPAVHETVETIVKLRQSGIVKEAADWTEYIASFNNGSAAGTIQGCWIIGSVTLVPEQKGLWGMTNVPRLTCEGATNYSSQGGSSWMVFADDPKAEAAVDFLSQTFGASVDFYQIILKSSGAIATYLPAAGGPAYAEPHDFFADQKVFEDLMAYSANIPMVEYGMYNYEARDAVAVAVEEVFNGSDLDAALQSAQETLEFLMED